MGMALVDIIYAASIIFAGFVVGTILIAILFAVWGQVGYCVALVFVGFVAFGISLLTDFYED